jgi:transcriptional regulator with XRE-family HTH domain
MVPRLGPSGATGRPADGTVLSAAMGEHLWSIVQAYVDHQDDPPSARQLAERLDVSHQTVANWRTQASLPSPRNLRALAELTGADYEQVLRAALVDAGYLP